VQVLEIFDQKEFDSFLVSQNASVLQSWAWGEFQKKLGRKVWRLIVSSDLGKTRAAATLVKMSLPRGKSFLYCPRGPVVMQKTDLEKVWQLFLDKLSDINVLEKPLFLRVDPLVSEYDQNFNLSDLGFQKINWEVQPKDTTLLNLQKTEAELLHEMKLKTRYNIRLAQKKGVEVKSTVETVDLKYFWLLMQETVKRDRFKAHQYNYYLNLVKSLGRSGSVELLVAYYNSRPLAAAIVSYFANTATYLHGASTDRFRSVMAPHLIQWTVILNAKKRGMKFYDFGGVAPTGAHKNHAWSGITRFKKGFGGQEVSYMGAYDLPYNKLWYKVYKAVRKVNRVF